MKIALFGNDKQRKKARGVSRVLQALRHEGAEISIEADFAAFLRDTLRIAIDDCRLLPHDAPVMAHAAIAIGGDGTFLSTAARIEATRIPILGINTGHLGFLTACGERNIEQAVHALCAGAYTLQARSLIHAEVVQNGKPIALAHPNALNEIALLKHSDAALLQIQATIDGEILTRTPADGMIIATPTGSTAYSLSCGGPILLPTSRNFCLTPVAPHSLTARPVVVSEASAIVLKVRSRNHSFLLSIDGRSHTLGDQVEIRLTKAPYVIHVIRLDGQSFLSTLREKLHWEND